MTACSPFRATGTAVRSTTLTGRRFEHTFGRQARRDAGPGKSTDLGSARPGWPTWVTPNPGLVLLLCGRRSGRPAPAGSGTGRIAAVANGCTGPGAPADYQRGVRLCLPKIDESLNYFGFRDSDFDRRRFWPTLIFSRQGRRASRMYRPRVRCWPSRDR